MAQNGDARVKKSRGALNLRVISFAGNSQRQSFDKQLELGDRLDLSSYLLEPVQRIPRYKLFLNDLVKTYNNYELERSETDSRISKLSVDSDETGGSNGEGSDSDETPLESLKLAKNMVECVLTAIDDIMALENIEKCPLNLLNQGRLLRQNEFIVTDTSRRKQLMRVFLFDKVLLLALVYRKLGTGVITGLCAVKAYAANAVGLAKAAGQMTVEQFLYHDHIPVDDLGITAKNETPHKFMVWYKKRTLKCYKLEIRDEVARNAWVDEITTLLWKQIEKRKERAAVTKRFLTNKLLADYIWRSVLNRSNSRIVNAAGEGRGANFLIGRHLAPRTCARAGGGRDARGVVDCAFTVNPRAHRFRSR
ncbi:Puratrophin-1 [Eumeta japonica]|uniref:Puratrophin-1 n=1 Tax=Eumeta variegata TaxID=151549 RepID=A0A4C1VTJ2_EUMVA|nr:Puratrophin-1 [Eumeta japonica]